MRQGRWEIVRPRVCERWVQPRYRRRLGSYTEAKPASPKVTAMSYVLVEDVAATWERYDRFAAPLREGVPAGLILHAAGPTDEGFRIVQVWESEEAWKRFAASPAASGEEGADGAALVLRALRPQHVIYGPRPGRDS
jgi:hypothetical protein